MGVNSLPKTVTRQRRGCDLNPGLSATESTRLHAISVVQFICCEQAFILRAFLQTTHLRGAPVESSFTCLPRISVSKVNCHNVAQPPKGISDRFIRVCRANLAGQTGVPNTHNTIRHEMLF